MADPLLAASAVASSALSAQSTRMRVVAENMANAQSTGTAPGADPYRRKTVTFASELDRITGANRLEVTSIGYDRSAFRTEFRPGDPAADESGYVKMPNVNVIVEMADMREASRSYEANLQVVKQVRELANMMIDLLKGQG